MSTSIGVSFTDCSGIFLVGGAFQGGDLLQNIYGMYVAKDQSITGVSNLAVAREAHKFLFRPLHTTSMGSGPMEDEFSFEKIESHPTSERYLVRRDWKDSLVQTWKLFGAELTWEEFINSPLGFESISSFESKVSQLSFTKTVTYENLIAQPHQELSEFIHSILPQEDNPDNKYFGEKRRLVNFDIVDLVIQDSSIRELREGSDSGLLESVGIHKELLTEDQISEVDEFVASL